MADVCVGFSVRAGILNTWGSTYGFTQTELGGITGGGLTGFGIVILLCVGGAAGAALAGFHLRRALWRTAAIAALLLSLAAVALQAAQFASLGFGPTDGGYASVFVGWTGTFTIFLLGACYWLATAVAEGRHRSAGPDLRPASVEAAGFVLLVLAAIELAAFILLYLVA